VRPLKRLGQHFLSDAGVARRIAEAVDPGPGDLVIEIGPGTGALTIPLLARCERVVGVEVDPRLCEALSARLDAGSGFHLVHADALEVDFEALVRRHGADHGLLAGNLPYNVATPLILRVLSRPALRRAVFMVQREVAQRIVAPPGDRQYGSLSVAVRIAATPRRLFDVRSDAFVPAPRVHSTVLELDLRRPASPIPDEHRESFTRLVRWTFGHRRKMLRGTLRSLPGYRLSVEDLVEVGSRSGIDLSRRPETLDIREFERLAVVLAGWRPGSGRPRPAPDYGNGNGR
jgi:16S rRNA (adenine1518-N6/adenine1519-N6)-dimethyltransferase